MRERERERDWGLGSGGEEGLHGVHISLQSFTKHTIVIAWPATASI